MMIELITRTALPQIRLDGVAMEKRAQSVAIYLAVSLLLVFASGCGSGASGGGGGGNGGVPGPTLTSLSPASKLATDPSFYLTVNGTGFVPGGTIYWNRELIGAYTFISSTQVTIPISEQLLNVFGGPVSVQATIPTSTGGGISDFSNPLTFTVGGATGVGACGLYGEFNLLFTGFAIKGAASVPVTIVGNFGVDATGSVAGEEDYKDSTTTLTAQVVTGTCTNSATPGEGTLTLTTAAGTATYTWVDQFPPNVGRLSESDDTNGISGSGEFIQETPAATLTGDQVVALVGSDATGGRMSVVGRLTVTNGQVSGGEGNINDAGTITSKAAITGSVSTNPVDAFNRSTGTLTVGSDTLQIAFYVGGFTEPSAGVGGGVKLQVFVMDVDTGGPILGGNLTLQGLLTGLNSNFQLNAPIVFGTWGVDSGGLTSDTTIGRASNFNSGTGTFDLVFDRVSGGTAVLDTSVTGATYSVASNGRVDASVTSGGNTNTYVFYLDQDNDGFMQETSGSAVGFGRFELQSSVSFNDSPFAAGTFLPSVPTSPDGVAQVLMNGGNITGGLTGSYSLDPTGRGTGAVNLPVFGSTDIVFYVINAGTIEVMGSDGVEGDAISYWQLQ
jgi:hypothetical protein